MKDHQVRVRFLGKDSPPLSPRPPTSRVHRTADVAFWIGFPANRERNRTTDNPVKPTRCIMADDTKSELTAALTSVGVSRFLSVLGVPGKIASAILDYFTVVTPLAKAQSERIAASAAASLADGHSQACAGARAADEQSLLDGDLTRVIKMGGGCKKCGI